MPLLIVELGMIRDEDSVARVRLAGRILKQIRCGGGQPIILSDLSEIAQLRFLAESNEEAEMPLDKLALKVIEREGMRMGISSPRVGDPDERKELNAEFQESVRRSGVKLPFALSSAPVIVA